MQWITHHNMLESLFLMELHLISDNKRNNRYQDDGDQRKTEKSITQIRLTDRRMKTAMKRSDGMRRRIMAMITI